MSTPRQAAMRNRLLMLMKERDFDSLAPHLEFLQLGKGYVICEPDTAIEHIYFMESGIGSIIVTSPEGLEAEAGLFGREGLAPTSLLLGAETASSRIIVQVADDAWRIAKLPFLKVLENSPEFKSLLLKYVQTLAVQVSHTALSNAVHPIDERLARWILMCDDRSDGQGIALTHDYMSVMLAVRRPSVTTALHVLEGNGFIRSERGLVFVRNRRALEQFASDAYGKPEAVYGKLIGPMA